MKNQNISWLDFDKLPPKEEHHKEHFIARLFERYGIKISSEEYESLSNMPFETLYWLTDRKRLGILSLKGQKVLAINHKRLRLFLTAIPFKLDNLPPPRNLRCIGFQNFNRELKDIYLEIEKGVEVYKTMSKEDFFTSTILKIPIHIRHWAYLKDKERNILPKIVNWMAGKSYE
jgi:hypothetical protein